LGKKTGPSSTTQGSKKRRGAMGDTNLQVGERKLREGYKKVLKTEKRNGENAQPTVEKKKKTKKAKKKKRGRWGNLRDKGPGTRLENLNVKK